MFLIQISEKYFENVWNNEFRGKSIFHVPFATIEEARTALQSTIEYESRLPTLGTITEVKDGRYWVSYLDDDRAPSIIVFSIVQLTHCE